MKPPARLGLRLLGRLAIAYADDGAPIRLSTRKAGALIAYLAMCPEQSASREELAALLWGSSSDQQARQSLRQALVLLRKELGGAHFVVADAAVVRLQGGLWSADAGEFDRLSRSSDPQDLAHAAALFEGEFLTGLNIDEETFDEWVSAQRQRVQLAAARLCETFAARPELVADAQQAVVAVERLVALDPLREEWHRLALTLYARYRGRNEALAQAEAFAETLRRELGVAPEKATRALVDKIRACEAASAHASIALITPPASSSKPVLPAPQPPARVAAPAEASPAAVPPNQRPIRSPRAAATVVAVAAAILLAAIGLTINHLRDANRREAAQAPSTRAASIDRWRPPGGLPGQEQLRAAIAVMPFVAQGDAATLQPAADAIAEDLINVLAQVPAIRVVSRATMESYRGRTIDVAAVAAELDVSYVLEGVVRAEGDRLRVNVELINPATRSPAWSARIERASGKESEVRDEIVTQLARELQIGTPAVETAQAPADPSMRQLYQQGWAAIYASGRSPEKLHESEQAFARALAQDPQSRWAKMGLANAHALEAAMMVDADIDGHLAKAEELIAALDVGKPGSAGTGFAMGVVHVMRGRPEQAIESFRRAIAANPSHAPSYAGIGHAMVFAGRAAEGLTYIQYAMRLSPRDAQRAHWLRFFGEGELELGHHEKAIDLLHQSVAMAPSQPQTLRVLAIALAAGGRLDEAHRTLAEMRRVNPALTDQRLLHFADNYKTSRPENLRGTQLLLAPTGSQEPSRAADQAAKTAPPTQSSGVATILILPFGQLGEDDERSRLWADIMADDLTNAVSRVGGFRVISRQTAAAYRGKRVDPKAIGAELGVQYLLDGRVEARDEGFRASVELIDTKSGLRAWSGNYQRGGDDFPVIVDEIVRSVGRELQVEVTRIASSRDSGDLDVHTLIYKGFAALGAGWRDSAALAQAQRYFTEARARDPNSTRAMTGLGAYHVAAALKLPRAERESDLAEAETLLRGVIERRPDVGGPSMFLGMVSYLRGQDDEAIRWFTRELERNPSQSRAYAHLGRALARSGKPEDGLKQILYAIRLSPNDPAIPEWLAFAGGAELELGHSAKAIEYLERALSLQAATPPELVVLAAARALEGDLGAARMRLDQAQQKSADFSRAALARRFVEGPTRAGEARLTEGLRLVLAPARDPWASPPSPSPSRHAGDPTAAVPKKNIPLLVLPFTTSGDTAGATQPLADMVTDDLTNLLSRVASLRVISRQTALAFKGQPIDIAAVGKELQVRYVLEGTMRMQDDKVRINLELTDPATRLPVWTTWIEHAAAERSSIIDEIVGRLARELQVELIGIEAERRSKDNDTDALVARGWAALFDISAAGYRQAESHFRAALDRDPQSVPALIGMGAYHARIGALALDNEPLVHRAKAQDLLREAVRRDPNSSAAHFYLGLALKRPPTLQQSIDEMQRAIELNPSFPAAHVHIGHSLGLIGRPADGIAYVKYGLRLSPRDTTLGVFLDMAGDVALMLNQLDAAIDDFRRAAELKPAYPRPWAGLAAACALTGRMDEARNAIERLRSLMPGLSSDRLIEQFGHNAESRLNEGLRLAFAPAQAATAHIRTAQ